MEETEEGQESGVNRLRGEEDEARIANESENRLGSAWLCSAQEVDDKLANIMLKQDNTVFLERPLSTIPKRRQDLLRWNGWGYKNSGFQVSYSNYRDWLVFFTGEKYKLGNMALPFFPEWVSETVGVDFHYRTPPKLDINTDEIPKPVLHVEFINDVRSRSISFSTDPVDRLVRSHGQTLREIFSLRESMIERIPDLIVWPENHDEVVALVDFAAKWNVVLIPIGGGTCVSGALTCPENESRMIVSVDMTLMNRILWIDEKNLTAKIEAGIIGQDLERALNARGFCVGHEPDSIEFSSLGGWVATRASGMKKNVYGNIEDLVVHVRMVTPVGVAEKNCEVPRISSGPDIHHFIMGSEGTLGIVTEVTMKIRPLPACQKYGSIVFPNFESGVACLREIAREKCAPASIRLMDNNQFKFGLSLKAGGTLLGKFVDGIKKMYLTQIKGFDPHSICVVTLVFEGSPEQVQFQQNKVYTIAKDNGGIPAGEENGKRGYMLTYVIAYIRDLGMDYSVVAESFETSVPWDRVIDLCRNVKDRITAECVSRKIWKYFVTYRVTQTYDAGACVYFYFAFNYKGIANPVHVYEEIETIARDEILATGGSISHHHGVGKLRKQWLEKSISVAGLQMLKAVKNTVDPQNIFGNGNLMID